MKQNYVPITKKRNTRGKVLLSLVIFCCVAILLSLIVPIFLFLNDGLHFIIGHLIIWIPITVISAIALGMPGYFYSYKGTRGLSILLMIMTGVVILLVIIGWLIVFKPSIFPSSITPN